MASHWISIALPLLAVYAAFVVWYGGNGTPMTQNEKEAALQALATTDASAQTQTALEEVRELLASDDGKEFVMQNLVRYRSRRDFVRFATEANQAEKFVHKWASIEKTHIFPVKPVLSLFTVRATLGLLLLCFGLLIHTLTA